MKSSFETLTDIDEIVDNEMTEETSKRAPDVQYPNGRTYGECVEDEKRSIRMINGLFVPTIRIKDKPCRLSRAEAIRYYKEKLRKAWETIPLEKYEREVSDKTTDTTEE